MATIDTGLMWEADSAYLVYAAGTYLGASYYRQFYKSYDGYAVAVYQETPDGWHGPILVSTVRENVYYRYGNTTLGVQTQFFYDGRLWYINANHHYQNQSWDTPLPMFYNTYATLEEAGPHILDQAGVRWSPVSRYYKSFLAGVAIGLLGVEAELSADGL